MTTDAGSPITIGSVGGYSLAPTVLGFFDSEYGLVQDSDPTGATYSPTLYHVGPSTLAVTNYGVPLSGLAPRATGTEAIFGSAVALTDTTIAIQTIAQVAGADPADYDGGFAIVTRSGTTINLGTIEKYILGTPDFGTSAALRVDSTHFIFLTSNGGGTGGATSGAPGIGFNGWGVVATVSGSTITYNAQPVIQTPDPAGGAGLNLIALLDSTHALATDQSGLYFVYEFSVGGGFTGRTPTWPSYYSQPSLPGSTVWPTGSGYMNGQPDFIIFDANGSSGLSQWIEPATWTGSAISWGTPVQLSPESKTITVGAPVQWHVGDIGMGTGETTETISVYMTGSTDFQIQAAGGMEGFQAVGGDDGGSYGEHLIIGMGTDDFIWLGCATQSGMTLTFARAMSPTDASVSGRNIGNAALQTGNIAVVPSYAFGGANTYIQAIACTAV